MTPEPEPVVLPKMTREQWLLAHDNLTAAGQSALRANTTISLIHGPCPPPPAPYWRAASAVTPLDIGVSVSVVDSDLVAVLVRHFGDARPCSLSSADARKMAQALFLAARYVEANR